MYNWSFSKTHKSYKKKTAFEEKKYSGHIYFMLNMSVLDSVCHARLFYKLKNIGIAGVMFQCFKNFLSKRGICTGEGKTYSPNKQIDYGYSTGLSYCTYLIKQYYTWSPKSIIKNTHVAQYADDIAINFGLKQLLESTRIRGW